MMTDELDKTLREWAQRHAPGGAHLQSLADEIRLKAVAAKPVRNRSTKVPPALTRLGYATAGAAVALAVVAVVLQRGEKGTLERAAPNDPTALALFAPDEVVTGKHLFDEFERLFTDRLRWVAQSNGDIAMGVEALQGPAEDPGRPAVVRLVVVARRVGDVAWQPVWSTDVLLRGEEMVEVAAGRDSKDLLALWVYPLENGKVAVDTTLSLHTPVKISARSNTVVGRKEPNELVSVREGDAEYRVLQTVAILDNGC